MYLRLIGGKEILVLRVSRISKCVLLDFVTNGIVHYQITYSRELRSKEGESCVNEWIYNRWTNTAIDGVPLSEKVLEKGRWVSGTLTWTKDQ